MERRGWIIPTESQRDDALFALKDAGFKVGRHKTFTGEYTLSAQADEADWEKVEQILRRNAPGAIRSKGS